MNAVFICVLAHYPEMNAWGPKVLHALDNNLPRNVYVTLRWNHAKPTAIGLAQLTPEQKTVVDALSGVWVFDVADWRNKTVSQIPAAIRNKLNTLLADRGINAGIAMSDTIMQAMSKIVLAIAELGETPEWLLSRYQEETGEAL